MNSIIDDIKQAFTRQDNALNQLILINILVFVTLLLLEVILKMSGNAGYYVWIASQFSLPSNPSLFIWRPWTLFTYSFTHTGFLHIIFNMLNLYWFGMLIREYLGNKKLVSLYILGGLCGAILYFLFYNFVPYFIQRGSAEMIGASASVLAITVAAATLLPDFTFHLFLFGSVKIKYIAAFLVLLSISGAIGPNAGGNVAHIGGALLGYFFIRQLQRGTDMGRPIHGFWSFITGLFKRRPNMKVSYNNQTSSRPFVSAPVNGKPSQVEIDLILDKISKSGYESLSKEEKQKLFRASQKD